MPPVVVRGARRGLIGLLAVAVLAGPAVASDWSNARLPGGSLGASGPEPMVTVGGLTFHSSGYGLRNLRHDEMYWYRSQPVSLTDSGVHDSTGVRMVLISGKLYNHPVAQAQYAIQLMNAYFLTKDSAYLDRAILNGQRLLDTATQSRGAMYFPYPFDFALYGDPNDVVHAPWYSGMAQGQALTAFYLIFQATNGAKWSSAMDLVFQSFLNDRVADAPSTIYVDPDGYYWIAEYPTDPVDYVLNGHIFALEGLLDYYRLTQKPEALTLASGAITSVLHYVPLYRVPGWGSYYSITRKNINLDYSLCHIVQLLQLYTDTGRLVFAEWSDRLRADYPDPRVRGNGHFGAGTITGYTFVVTTGAILGTKTYTLARSSSAPIDQRRRVYGRAGYWLHVTSGIWAGYYVRESPTAYVAGAAFHVSYDPYRRVTFLVGTYTGYTFTGAGAVATRRTGTISSSSWALGTPYAIIDGRAYVSIRNGLFAGYWVPLTSSVYFTPSS